MKHKKFKKYKWYVRAIPKDATCLCSKVDTYVDNFAEALSVVFSYLNTRHFTHIKIYKARAYEISY